MTQTPHCFTDKSHLYLIDGSGYIFRAFHALPPLSRKSDGLSVGAVAGFCNILWRFLANMASPEKGGEDPSHLAVIFDPSGPSFRNALYPAYKAHRPPAPPDLIPQFPLIKEASLAFGVVAITVPGFEADDVIASYAAVAAGRGARVTIVSSDKDLMQLVSDKISLMDPVKQSRIERQGVIDKFGLGPEKVVEIQALAGDSADNIPGAPGIGIKTAAQLLQDYGDLETLLQRAGEIPQPKRRETLIKYADQVRLSRKLVTLSLEVPLTEPLETLAIKPPDPEILQAFLKKMEFRTLIERIRKHLVFPDPPQGLDGQNKDHEAFEPVTFEPGTTDRSLDKTENTSDGPVFEKIDTAAYVLIQDLETLKSFIERAFEQGFVAFDTETDSLSSARSNLVGISLALNPGEAAYIPLGHRPGHQLDLGDNNLKDFRQIPLDIALQQLKPLLESEAVLKVGQNIKYDMAVLSRYKIAVGPIEDTMLLSYVIEGGGHGHGMDDLSQKHLSHKPIAFKEVAGSGKTQISFADVDLVKATAYAAEDADVTLRLYQVLKPRLYYDRLATVYETLERPLPGILASMECRGIKISLETLYGLSQDFAQRMQALEHQAHAVLGRGFNLGSPKQIGEILFQDLGLPGARKTAGGSYATDVGVLEDLARKGHILPQILLDWRQLAKLKNTYTDSLIACADPKSHRVHTSFSLAATTTGRLSSSDPNLQNIPIRTEDGRKIRKAFIAEAGHQLISADYSQIELRLLAHMGDIKPLQQAFHDGVDIHAMTASEMFGVPLADLSADIRRQAKAINFGIIYGISAFGLANQLNISQKQASDYIRTYFERFPGIRDYMEATKDKARRDGFVSTLFGRKIMIADIEAKSMSQRQFAERAAINAPIQGSAADIIRRAMIRMEPALKASGLLAKMLLQVHDELVFEAPEAELDAACALIKKVMEQAAEPAQALSVPLTVEARSAPNWEEAH